MNRGTMVAMCASVSIVALSAPAFAQDVAPVQPEAAATQSNEGLAEIIVTAQRRAENLQRVGIAVTAVTTEDLKRAGVSQPDDLGKLAPALTVQPSAGSSVSIYLRGVGTQAGNAYAENAVSFNFNGVYIGRPTAPVGTFFDLDRVEVVKGPQGTLYGRNATGGAINVLPTRPDLNSIGGNVEVEYGNYDNKRASAALNLPISSVVALRVAGQVVDRDGYLSDGTNDERGEAVRASLLVKPSNSWSALIVADYFHQHGKGQGSLMSPGSGFPAGTGLNGAPPLSDRIGASDPRSIAYLAAYAATLPAPPFCGGFGKLLTSGCVITPQNDSYLHNDFYGVSATIEGDLGFGTLTVQPAYRRTETNENGYVPGFKIQKVEKTDQMSVEARITSNSGQPLRYVVGAFYFNESQDADNFFTLGNLSTNRFLPRLRTESKAVFGQLTYDVGEKFRLIAGGRYTDESRNAQIQAASGGLPGVILPPLRAPFTGNLNFKKFTWKAGVEFDAGPHSLVYANVATGFKSGGFFTAAPPNNTFGPENLTAYTVGAKNRFFDNKLQLNVEGFYWDYRDQQVTFVGGIATGNGTFTNGGITVNAGKATMYGGEVEALFAPTHLDRFNLNVQYLKGKYDSLVFDAFSNTGANIRQGCTVVSSRLANPGVNNARFYTTDCSGQQTINSPEWTANAGYQHTFELGAVNVVAGAQTRIESSRYLALTYLPEARQGAYRMSDAFVTLESAKRNWSITAYINNIEDRVVLANAGLKPVIDVNYVTLRPPRTYGVRMGYKF